MQNFRVLPCRFLLDIYKALTSFSLTYLPNKGIRAHWSHASETPCSPAYCTVPHASGLVHLFGYRGPQYPKYDTGISPPATLAGKRLILGNRSFEFPDGDYQRSHRNLQSPAELFPLAYLSVVQRTSGELWALFFTTSDSGTAVFSTRRNAPVTGTKTCIQFRIESL